jgi:hypothetical protein
MSGIRKIVPALQLVVLGALLTLIVGHAQAAVIISNLEGNDGTQSASLDNLRNKGMGFTMPAGDDYLLDSATLRLNLSGTDVHPIVQLWSNSVSNLPGSPLTTLANPSFSAAGIADYTFSPSSPFTLAASNTYWLVTYGTGAGNSFDWMADGSGITPTGVATHFGEYFDTDGPPPTGFSPILNSYAISAHVVPEPSTMALVAISMLLLLTRRVGRMKCVG